MSQIRIMVVEDESIVALDIQHHLTKLGYQVVSVTQSGEEAAQQASQMGADLILMSTSQIQNEHYNIPVVYLATQADSEALARTGATYLVKPFDALELQAAIETTHHQHQLEQRKHTYATQLEQEIAARKRVELALRASEARYRLLIETSPDAIALVDLNGRMLMANQSVADLLGYESVDTLLNRRAVAFDIITPRERERAMSDLQNSLAQGRLQNLEYHILRQDGSEIPVDINVSIVKSPDGFPQAVIGVVRDITLQQHAKQTELALATERERVHELRQFLSHASHHLRTPLTTIKTSLYLLEKTFNSESRQRQIELLDKQADLLRRLLEDMLIMTRLEDESALETAQIDLNRVASDIVAKYLRQAECKTCDLRFIPGQKPLTVRADAHYLGQAIERLVQNALQFIPEHGTITVQTSLMDEQATVEVRDSVYRGDNTPEPDISDMSLEIARRIAKLHNGTLDVTSTAEEGSAFRINLPFTGVR